MATIVLIQATAAVCRGAQRRAGVEAEPAEPQQPGAEHHQGQVVRPHRVLAEADPLAQHQREGETGGTGVDVHRRTAGEVDRPEAVGDPAAAGCRCSRRRRTPSARPGSRRTSPRAREDHPGAELGAVGDGAADQCHRDDREHCLEGDEGQRRDAVPTEPSRRRRGRGHQLLQADELEVADQPADDVVAERQGVAVQHPQHADEAEAPKLIIIMLSTLLARTMPP